jgi:hypothetical protein
MDSFMADAAPFSTSPAATKANALPDRRDDDAAFVPLARMTRTVPIVFVQAADPVGAGLVASLARPGGNVTGFAQFEFGLSGKWLQLLKEMAPRVTRVAVLRDSSDTAGIGQWGAVQAVAPLFGVELTAVGVGDPGEVERSVAALAREPNGALIVTGSGPLFWRLSAWSGVFAKKIRCGRRFRCRRLRSAAVTRLWPRRLRSHRPYSSLISSLLGLEGISKRKPLRARRRTAQVKDPDLCGRQAGGGGGFGAGIPNM